jgi:hypothetical protein
LSELPYDRLKDFAIAAVLSLLSFEFEVAIESQDSGIFRMFAVGRKDAVHTAENAVLPVDESTVTIEGQNFESGEV